YHRIRIDFMHVHTIDAQIHTDFLAQQREDPVTGEPIRAGEEVIFCASCKSAFLKDSWTYLGNEHCGQAETLKEVPQQQTLRIRWELEEQIWPPEPPKSSSETALKWILDIIASLAGALSCMGYYSSAYNMATIFMVFFLIFGGIRLAWRLHEKPIRRFSLFRNGIRTFSPFKRKSYRLRQINELVFTSKQFVTSDPNTGYCSYNNYLTIYLQSGKKVKYKLWSSDTGLNPKSKNLLWGLAKVSAYIPVRFLLFKRQEEVSYATFLKRHFERGEELVVETR
ncbi:MAG: hypothetical protein AAF740_06515, partial [Bacteroidota bacterium]